MIPASAAILLRLSQELIPVIRRTPTFQHLAEHPVGVVAAYVCALGIFVIHPGVDDHFARGVALDTIKRGSVCHRGSDDGFYTGSRPPALEARCRPPVHNPARACKARSQPLSLIDGIKHHLHTDRYANELSGLP